jgi:hypothetical protein
MCVKRVIATPCWCSTYFGRVVLEVAIGELVTDFATEETKVVVHLMLVFSRWT